MIQKYEALLHGIKAVPISMGRRAIMNNETVCPEDNAGCPYGQLCIKDIKIAEPSMRTAIKFSLLKANL